MTKYAIHMLDKLLLIHKSILNMMIIIIQIVMIIALGKIIYGFSTTEDKLTIKLLAFHGFMFFAISVGVMCLSLKQADIYFNNTLILFTLIEYIEISYLLNLSFICFFQIGRYFYLKVKKPIKINSLDDAIKYMASIGMSRFKVIDGKLAEHKENLYWAVQYEQFNGSLKNTLYISTNGKIITHSISVKIVGIDSKILKRKKFLLVDKLGFELKKIG